MSEKTKLCNGCGIIKKIDEFYVRSNGLPRTPCISCYAIKHAEQRQKRLENMKVYHIRRKYGMTPEDRQQMLDEQGGGCAVCGSQDQLRIDHDHNTDKVRGILCNSCNVVLGFVGDDIDRLIALAAYLMQNVDLLERVGKS